MPLSLRQRQSVFALNLSKLILWAYQQGYEVTLGEAERTAYQQAEYQRTGRSRTANSQHLKRLAQDLNLFRGGQVATDAWRGPLPRAHLALEMCVVMDGEKLS